jgi:hypothetical protein
MVTPSPGRERAAELKGRLHELGFLSRLIDAVRAGESQVLVLSGEAGVGKTALLDYVAGHASGCRVVRAIGVQSEMELAFAAGRVWPRCFAHALLVSAADGVLHLVGVQTRA